MKPHNAYKSLAEDLFTVLEGLTYELPNAPSMYEDEDGIIDYDQYHEHINERLLCLAQMFGTRLQQLNPKFQERSLMMKAVVESKKAYLDPLAENSDLAAIMRYVEAKLSEYSPILLVSTK